ncbi:hydantoinase/oxoprolinase [Lentinus tigrinus ALCF2SS1-7]|uniref:Hydantoinase/oxoprolinase n=1 Tax=Lentinus tigrinus ALCF2SS1-6 TaxID=1328759 RepID=A0A5C2SPC5_9APHY|nr:hydantoinase/oxoprolinase [Lentinus tigrinus ALCF2SS1-6]RPD79419.1 hydantoinase/oxoprolinase [Lentinus tigrinus ALCF2SS1-7]
MLRIGVDVGGTNTDGVLIDVSRVHEPSRGVLAHYKAPTTPDVSTGIENAVREVLKLAAVPPENVASVSIGTTAFINAVLEADARRLAKVAVIRLCGAYTRQCPPFIDFPKRLQQLTEGHVAFVDGGFEIDGREIYPLNEAQILEQCAIIKEKGLKNIVLSGIYSPLDTEGRHEVAAKAIIERELGPSVNVVCSRDVGQVGLLERENASILNASILTFAQRTIRGFQKAMLALRLTCPLFLTQNDGTLTTAASAAQLPIRTFASGPTNSMRGAAFLAGLDDHKAHEQRKSMIVVDIGGTTSDVGVLLPSGFPRQAASFIEVGGVRTNFAMADVQSIGLGGGSIVRVSQTEKGSTRVTVGPESVGHNLMRDAKVFGGTVFTSTDLVVASGRAELGEKAKVQDVSAEVITLGMVRIKKLLERIIDKMKTSPEDITVLLVGGGSIIAPDELVGVKEIIRPPFFGVANAVGAAMAKVAGEVDTIELLAGRDIHTVVEAIKLVAINKAIAAGADSATTKIVEVANIPVQYVTNQATRIIVRAAGDLAPQAVASLETSSTTVEEQDEESKEEEKHLSSDDSNASSATSEDIDIDIYKPTILPDRRWKLSEVDLEWIAEGCGVLGTGGGGSPYPPFLMARQALRDGKMIYVLDPDDVPEGDTFIRCSFMGSPSVAVERLQGGDEIPAAARALMKYLGIKDFTGSISEEIGGGNGIQPMIVAAEMGKAVLDCDLMGRAYPNMYQTLPGAYDIPNGLWPCAISDGIGSTLVLPTARSSKAVEDILRAATTEMGSKSGVSMAPLDRKTCTQYGVPHSVSQAWRIGRAIALCRKHNDLKGIPKAILELQNGACLFVGKIIDVRREVRKGFTWGEVTIVPLLEEEEEDSNAAPTFSLPVKPDDKLVIPFQNENLYAYIESADGDKKIHVTVPDLITVLDSQNGAALGTPDYRYGLRVTVIAMAGHPSWITPQGLDNGGPTAFGLNGVPFTPIGPYKDPKSVIKEFGSA